MNASTQKKIWPRKKMHGSVIADSVFYITNEWFWQFVGKELPPHHHLTHTEGNDWICFVIFPSSWPHGYTHLLWNDFSGSACPAYIQPSRVPRALTLKGLFIKAFPEENAVNKCLPKKCLRLIIIALGKPNISSCPLFTLYHAKQNK